MQPRLTQPSGVASLKDMERWKIALPGTVWVRLQLPYSHPFGSQIAYYWTGDWGDKATEEILDWQPSYVVRCDSKQSTQWISQTLPVWQSELDVVLRVKLVYYKNRYLKTQLTMVVLLWNLLLVGGATGRSHGSTFPTLARLQYAFLRFLAAVYIR